MDLVLRQGSINSEKERTEDRQLEKCTNRKQRSLLHPPLSVSDNLNSTVTYY